MPCFMLCPQRLVLSATRDASPPYFCHVSGSPAPIMFVSLTGAVSHPRGHDETVAISLLLQHTAWEAAVVLHKVEGDEGSRFNYVPASNLGSAPEVLQGQGIL